ncbi:MAG: hypothetical protein WC445_04645 [Patescibacteria group bacterium]
MKIISKKLFVSTVLASILILSALPVFAQVEELQNFGKAAYGEAQAQYAEEQGPLIIAGKIINIALGAIGTIVVILFIFSGFLWMTAAGNEEKITKAKRILTNAIIGTVIVVMAYAISYFVINQLLRASGAPVTP